MFNGRLKITVISATELQETNFMKRLQLTESAPPVQLDPYVAIDVDEHAAAGLAQRLITRHKIDDRQTVVHKSNIARLVATRAVGSAMASS